MGCQLPELKSTWTPKVCRIIAFYIGFGPLFYLLLGVGSSYRDMGTTTNFTDIECPLDFLNFFSKPEGNHLNGIVNV